MDRLEEIEKKIPIYYTQKDSVYILLLSKLECYGFRQRNNSLIHVIRK